MSQSRAIIQEYDPTLHALIDYITQRATLHRIQCLAKGAGRAGFLAPARQHIPPERGASFGGLAPLSREGLEPPVPLHYVTWKIDTIRV